MQHGSISDIFSFRSISVINNNNSLDLNSYLASSTSYLLSQLSLESPSKSVWPYSLDQASVYNSRIQGFMGYVYQFLSKVTWLLWFWLLEDLDFSLIVGLRALTAPWVGGYPACPDCGLFFLIVNFPQQKCSPQLALIEVVTKGIFVGIDFHLDFTCFMLLLDVSNLWDWLLW